MKILMVSMPCLHFFRWVEQLRDAGHEVYWFDITDGGEKVDRLHWVIQTVGWKFRWDYPGRVYVKMHFPKLYAFIQRFNERNTAKTFEQNFLDIQPDIVHSFELQISCIPILSTMLKYKKVKWIYSSWGSDVYYFEKLNIEEKIFKQILQRINFLISDCNRDYEIVKKMGFKNQFLGVLPGNGGIDFPIEQRQLLRPQHRKSIIIKAYNDNIGRGMEILKSFDESLIKLLKGFDIILFGANQEIIDYVENNPQFETLKFIIYSKERSIRNKDLLQLMNNGYLYIANSLSDGMPNALLEAMGMGCFPIQSNPGNVMCEVIKNGENGLLINNPLDVLEINQKILLALKNRDMIENSFQTSVSKIRSKGNRTELRKIIVDIYEEVFLLQFNQ